MSKLSPTNLKSVQRRKKNEGKMSDIDVALDLLFRIVPIIVAVVALVYVIKQRGVVKKELLRKKYLENALTNLKESIKILKKAKIIGESENNVETDSWEDEEMSDAALTLRDFAKGTKKTTLFISYRFGIISEKDNIFKVKAIRDLNADGKNQLVYTLHDTSEKGFLISAEIGLEKYEELIASIPLYCFEKFLNRITKVMEKLLLYEEIYESINPNSIDNLRQFLDETACLILKVLRNKKTVEVDSEKLSTTKEVIQFLNKNLVNYSKFAIRLTKLSEILADLEDMCKQLFLKI